MSCEGTQPVAALVEHFFRHEAGRLVSVLTRLFGWRNFDLVEDTVQATLIQALQAWRARGVPDNPSAWMHQVAKNRIVDALRRDEVRFRVTREWAGGRAGHDAAIDELFLDTGIADSQLRMIFACCHPLLAGEDQIALTLKTLCGFGNSEIARALLVAEETVKKRLQRAKRALVHAGVSLDPPPAPELATRLDIVHQVLYLLFNEGHSASHGDAPIRTDLCEEAARLCHLLCSHQDFAAPSTNALMALMLFHAARLDARTDGNGAILLMEDQDRTKWDAGLIHKAREYLDRSASGKIVSPYHLEAGIALHHCAAPAYAGTDWRAILRLYDALVRMQPSPIYVLNRAIVIAEINGPRAGIRALEDAVADESLKHYHLLDATLGELYRRAGDWAQARHHLEAARSKTQSAWDHQIIERRLALIESWPRGSKF